MDDIAIVGMSGRFPGAPDVDSLWELVRDGRTGLIDVTDDQLRACGVPAAESDDPRYVARAGVLEDVDRFDAELFGVTPADAAVMDPQHRLLLECAWSLLESSGHLPEGFAGSIGVFAGCGANTYLLRNLLTRPEITDRLGWFLLRHTGNDKDFLPTGVSYRLDLRGPSVAVQTACSTSLVAVHLAVQSLQSLECDLALAGGVTVHVPHHAGYRYVDGEMGSPDGQCRPFDHRASGTVLTSGVGMVALRRLSDARAEGDHVLAVITGSAIGNDGGRKVGFFAPSTEGLADVAREALAVAGVKGSSVNLIQAHGSGTRIGDSLEVAALADAYHDGELVHGTRLTSVKGNIGHCDTASGVASLIAAVQALRHRTLPPVAGWEAPNPLLSIEHTPFVVDGVASPWPDTGHPRRASVNSLGVGGTNAHVIIEEAPQPDTAPAPSGPSLLLVSAGSAEAADTMLDRVHGHLAEHPALDRAGAANTLVVGRRQFAHRRAAIADHGQDVAAVAADFAPRVVLCLTGGIARPGAAAELARADERYIAARSTLAAVERASDGPTDPAEVDPAVLEFALARQLVAWGITPAAVIGRGAGEPAAAHLAGLLDLDEAVDALVTGSRPAGEPIPVVPCFMASTGRWVRPAVDPGSSDQRLDHVHELSSDLLGPADVLAVAGRSTASDALVTGAHTVVDLSTDGVEADVALLRAAGHLWALGAELQWDAIVAPAGRHRRVPLPTYPFSRDRHWIEPPAATPHVDRDRITPDKARAVGQRTTLGTVTRAWADMIGLIPAQDDDFFAMGGTSILAAQLVDRLGRELGITVGVAALLRCPTPALLAAEIDDGSARPDVQRCLVPITSGSAGTPLFVVHGLGGNVLNLRALGARLPEDLPLVGIQAWGCDGHGEPDATVEAMVQRYAAAIRSVRPAGPYLLGGYSGGGVVALEIAELLRSQGAEIAAVLLFDTFTGLQRPNAWQKLWNLARNTRTQGLATTADWFADWLRRRAATEDLGEARRHREEVFEAAIANHPLGTYAVDTVLLRAEHVRPIFAPDYRWASRVTGRFEERVVPGDHESLLTVENAPVLANRIDEVLTSLNLGSGHTRD